MNWNKDNLSLVTTEEFQYSDKIDDIINKLRLNKERLDEYDRFNYHAIQNNKAKVRHDEELNKIEELSNQISNIINGMIKDVK